MRKTTAINLTGQKFNRLTALEAIPGTSTTSRRWRCLCDCGVETTVTTDNLRAGRVKSCGCARLDAAAANAKKSITHGMTNTPTYKSWRSMKDRCSDTNNQDYGGRGIKVCSRWVDSFESFLADLGERPERHTLDRINTDGDYEPSNCRWSDKTTQARNRRVSRFLTINGEKVPLMQVAEEVGLSKTAAQYYFSLAQRLKDHYGFLPTP